MGGHIMVLDIAKVDVWAADVEDRVGGLADKLAPLAAAGANLQLVLARGESSRPGEGVVFITGLKGAKQARAADKAGFLKTQTLPSLRVEGPDKPGLGARITRALAAAGVSFRGLSGLAIGKRFAVFIAFDSKKDQATAARVLRKV
jgi:hypothetical protein